jgi:hypothetical protein
MKTMAACCVLTIGLAGAVSSAAVHFAPTTKPVAGNTATSKPAKGDTGLPPAVAEAVKTLSADMEATVKSAGKTARRTEADFFDKTPLTITSEQLLEILGKKLHRDARVDAYVKWQLLGGQKTPFQGPQVKTALHLYSRQPSLPPVPGSSEREQGALKQLTQRLKEDDIAAANAQWKSRLDEHEQLNGPLVSLRQSLYEHLPKTPQVIAAGLQDAEGRIEAGYDARKFIQQVTGDLRALAAGLKPNEINQLATLARGYAGKQGGVVSEGIEWKNGAAWKTTRLSFDQKQFDELASDLAKMAKMQ